MTWNHQILHDPSHSSVYNHTGYDVTNYFRSEATAKKAVENGASDGFMWNFSRKMYARIAKFHTFVGDV